MPHKYHFDIEITCGGCVKLVEKSLAPLEGSIIDKSISTDTKSVDITTNDNVTYDQVYEALSKSHKKIHGGSTVQ